MNLMGDTNCGTYVKSTVANWIFYPTIQLNLLKSADTNKNGCLHSLSIWIEKYIWWEIQMITKYAYYSMLYRYLLQIYKLFWR